MPEPIDQFTNQFSSQVSPFGASVSFFSSTPPEPNKQASSTRVATLRMSIEHLKSMAFIITRQVKRLEEESNTSYSLPTNMLNELNIGLEDWEAFWRSP